MNCWPSSPHKDSAMRYLFITGGIAILAVALGGCGDDNTTAKKSKDPYPATTGTTNPATTPADNTAKNTRDDGSTTTPLDQGMSKEDTAVTQAVRKAVMAEKEMSVNGQNVKIITKDGAVTLRGPVASEAERLKIVDLAQRIAGTKVVHNHLEVVTQ